MRDLSDRGDPAESVKSRPVRGVRGRESLLKELAEKGWYHSFQLPDGARIDGFVSLEQLRERYARFPIPEDLRGKRVLDIGAWDGWFSFESERRGAEVTAVDCVEFPNFLRIHRRLSSGVDYRVLDVFEMPGAGLGKFDIVLFLGVLYHLKHPLLALEIVCGLTTDVALVESFVTDGGDWREHRDRVPSMEFYETDELEGQLDNWVGPSVGCLLAMCRAAGFARVELLYADSPNATVACHRKWEPVPPPPLEAAPRLISLMNTWDGGINFSTRKDEYITCWFQAPRETVSRGGLRPEVDGFGVPALYVQRQDDGAWATSFRLPPGLGAGWKDVRLRFADSDFANALQIAVDCPLEAGELVLRGVYDGVTWRSGEVDVTDQGFVSCWVKGLGENCDRNNVRVHLGDDKLVVDWIGEPDGDGYRQVNAIVPGDVAEGEHTFLVEFGGAASPPAALKIMRR